ncbi:MAG TPA: SMC-Scp complex subunit ScpB [Ktedonobacteraceae bacterium]|nr:SMC-Scp complex subunit ScpB [Ktedonobacteraceae bacterium]
MAQTQDEIHETISIQGTQHTSETGDFARLATAAESLLFVSGRPLEYIELRKLLDIDDTRLFKVLNLLSEQLTNQNRGIRLQRLGSQVQLVTAPENARYIAALLGLPMTAKLTTAAMETLAVISYRQPMTRAQIEAVRGVNSDRALASLIQHGLVAEIGRATTVGRPALFATTSEFLQQFGLTSLHELPHVEQALSESQNSSVTQIMLEEQIDTVEQHRADAQNGLNVRADEDGQMEAPGQETGGE